MGLFRRTDSNHDTYQARKPENKCWSGINGHDDAERRKFFAPKESNLPADAFADDAVTHDDVGLFYYRETEIATGWSSLGGHSESNNETGRNDRHESN